MVTDLFYSFSLKTCDFPIDWVIEGQPGIRVTARKRGTHCFQV